MKIRNILNGKFLTDNEITDYYVYDGYVYDGLVFRLNDKKEFVILGIYDNGYDSYDLHEFDHLEIIKDSE